MAMPGPKPPPDPYRQRCTKCGALLDFRSALDVRRFAESKPKTLNMPCPDCGTWNQMDIPDEPAK